MEYFVTSKALVYHRVGDIYEVTNFLSGQSVKVDALVKTLLDRCQEPQPSTSVFDFFGKEKIKEEDVKALMVFLFNHKILLNDSKDALIDVRGVNTTFFGVPAVHLNVLPKDSVVMVGAPFGLGNAVDTGTKDFPGSFREFIYCALSCKGLADHLDSFRVEFVDPTFDYKNFCHLIENKKIWDLGDIFYHQGESNTLYYTRVGQVMERVVAHGNIPFVVGGDHSVTYPIIHALCGCHEHFDIFHFDAHADYKNSRILSMYDSIGVSLLNHATVMNYCAKEKSVDHIVQFGVREPYKAKCGKIETVTLNDIREKTPVYQDIVDREESVYLTFDIDYFDPLIAPGTASKINHGGQYRETLICLKEILAHKHIIGVDLVEVNANLDHSNMTSLLATQLVLYILGIIKL
ncbi:MAG: arginase family protein [Prevotella sp.]|jgi:agmatinase|nr:arginase family protein [Prevotella sp.]